MKLFTLFLIGLLAGCTAGRTEGRWFQQDTSIEARAFDGILLTTGDVQRPYRILGEISFDTTGEMNWKAIVNDSFFRSKFQKMMHGLSQKLSVQGKERKLKEVAYQEYGWQVNAIINVTYNETFETGDAYGRGLAITYTD